MKKEDWNTPSHGEMDHLKEMVDKATNSENYKEINKTIADGIDMAIDFTRASIADLFKGTKKNKESYSVQKDDNIINQRPKYFARAKSWNSILKMVLWIDVLMGIGLFLDLLTSFPYRIDMDNVMMLIFFVLPVLVIAYGGLRRIKVVKEERIRFNKYKRELGNNTAIPIADLCAAVGRSKEFVQAELNKFIEQDIFRQGRIVEDGEIFILDSRTYKLYKEHKLNEPVREEVFQETVLDQQSMEKSKAYVNQLTFLAEKVQDPMREKIMKLLSTIQKIFSHVKEHPEDAGELNKFIEYYLPTTVKLTQSYYDMSGAVSGNVKESMGEIEKTMDTIHFAFLRLLDKLYQDQLLDISSDISVMKTMLRQEGLLEDDFKIGK